MHELFVLGFISPLIPYRPWRLRREPKVLGLGRTVFFSATGDSRGCGECSAPTSVTPEEGGLHVRSVGTKISSQITRIWSRIVVG